VSRFEVNRIRNYT